MPSIQKTTTPIQKTIKLNPDTFNRLESLILWYGYANTTEAINKCIDQCYGESNRLLDLEEQYLKGFKKIIEINKGLEDAPVLCEIFEIMKPTINFLKTQNNSDLITQMKQVEITAFILRNPHAGKNDLDKILKNSVESMALTIQQRHSTSREHALELIEMLCKMSEQTHSHIAFTMLQANI